MKKNIKKQYKTSLAIIIIALMIASSFGSIANAYQNRVKAFVYAGDGTEERNDGTIGSRTSWSIETVDSSGVVGQDTSIALDSNNRPHISYFDETNADLKYAKWTGSSWSIETVDSTGIVGDYTSIALDSNNRPHISYRDWTNDDLKYAKWTGSSWSIETVDSSGGMYISIALDSNNRPHISYHGGYNDLKYAKWTGSSWSIETVDSSGWVGLCTSIALDSNNRPHISYLNYYGGLKYAKWTGSSWSIETVDSSGYVGLYTSIALDSNNRPHISYYDGTNYDLKYAKWTGSSWSIETVDSSGDVGMYTSIALDSNNRPHISYSDYTKGGLKYAKWTGSSWSIETVDSSGGDVGFYTSIALDSNNRPHISYYDWTSYDLKYAMGGNQPPNTPGNPNPEDGATGVDINADLSWTGGDPDGDTVYYDVYFEANDPTPDVLVSEDQTSTAYDPGTMEYETTYYWQIIAEDEHGATTDGPVWHFTTGSDPNNPPYTPSNPSPSNGATGVGINADLGWDGGDPDNSDTVTYDIYFGTSSNPPYYDMIGPYPATQTQISYDPGTMNYDTTYYWKIKAEDNHGAAKTGPIWHFTTEPEPNYPPDPPTGLLCEGQTNPQDVTDEQPEFSAIYNDPNNDDIATKYEIEVGDDNNWGDGAEMWDPPPGSCYVSEGSRCPDIEYDGITLEANTIYYWRIRFYDGEAWGSWSSTANFKTALLDKTFPVADAVFFNKWAGGCIIPGQWWLPEWNGEHQYPWDYGYYQIAELSLNSGWCALYDEYNEDADFVGGQLPIGAPIDEHVLAWVGCEYSVPVVTEKGTPHSAEISIAGEYGFTGENNGWLAVSYFNGVAIFDVSFWVWWTDSPYTPPNEYIVWGRPIIEKYLWHWNPLESNIDNYGKEITNINDEFTHEDTAFNEEYWGAPFYLGEGYTYRFMLRIYAHIQTNSLNNPFDDEPFKGWARSDVSAIFSNIKLHWVDNGVLRNGGNQPPYPPEEPQGSVGVIDTPHEFTTNTTDPDGDNVRYRWYWGDGNINEWSDLYQSGENVSANHTYALPGSYEVRVEAKDEYGALSGLSDTPHIMITVPNGSIEIESPSGGEEWIKGTTHEINWTWDGYVADEVIIGLFKDDELNRSISGDTPIPNTGSYQWCVDTDLDNGCDYKIAIFSIANNSLSNNFSITVDCSPPEWQNQGQNKTYVVPGENISLYAQGRDDVALDWAWLATNETGEWQNFTGDWWDINWDFSKKLRINNSIQDYQMVITVYREDGHDDASNGIIDCEDHCNLDFSDIRFVDQTNTTLLPYWTEETGTDNGDHYARIWMKTNGDDSIYMYYGNQYAVPVSNGTNTFDFFDDFEGTSYNSELWETAGDNTEWTVSDSILTMNSTGDQGSGGSSFNLKQSQSIEAPGAIWYTKIMAKRDTNSWATQPHLSLDATEGGDPDYMNMWYRAAGGDHMRTGYSLNGVDYGENDDISSEAWTNDAWHYFIMRKDPSAPYVSFQVLKADKTQWGNEVTNNVAFSDDLSPFYFKYYMRVYHAGYYVKIDWVFAANYVSPEPSWFTFGSEQNVSGREAYGSPMKMQENDQWQWSNFTWQNSSIPEGTVIGWRIYYSDTSGNVNCTDIMNFTIFDTIPPEITNVQAIPSEQVIGGYVNISAMVTDNIEVDEIYLYIEYPDSSVENLSITQNKTGDTYYCNKTYDQVGNHTYHIWANDTSGNADVSANCTFEIINTPPNTPNQPSGPTSGYICIPYDYSTSTTDPDSDNVKYGWDWDGDLVVDEWTDWYSSGETCTVSHSWDDPGTYDMRVKAKDTYDDESGWSDPLSVTIGNHPPNTPNNPDPEDGATDVNIDADLSWTGGDPDSCDTVTYNVYFEANDPTPDELVSENQSGTTYDPGTMNYSTTYYWQIVAWDNHGASSEGPIWSFVTKSETIEVDIELTTGWNLITIPVENSLWASTLAENISGCEMVSKFDAVNQTYYSYIVGHPEFDFPIEDGYGYFVLVDQSSTLHLEGPPIETVSVPLFVGWNMIGWFHEYDTMASSLCENISGCSMVSWFDAVNQSFESYIIGHPEFDFVITIGMGLFVLVDEESVWHGEG